MIKRLTLLTLALSLVQCSRTTLPVPAVRTPGGAAGVTFIATIPNKASWPPTIRRRERAIPASVRSIVVALSGSTILKMDVGGNSPLCKTEGRFRRCRKQESVSSGNDVFTIAAYDGLSGSGNLLASGDAHLTLQPGTTGTLALSLTGVPKSLEVWIANPYPPAGSPASTAISVSAYDVDGNVIVGPYSSPIAIRDQDRSGATALLGNSIPGSATHLTLTYNGSPLLLARLTATAQGAAGAVSTFVPAPTTTAEYTVPQLKIPPNPPLPVGVSDLCIGPDGNIWATGANSGAIIKITMSGRATIYPLLQTEPIGISVGPDGNMWFAEMQAGEIGKITTSGTITSYAFPVPKGLLPRPSATTPGPDGRVWYVVQDITTQGSEVAFVGAVTTDGKVSMYPLPSNSAPQKIIAGPDGNLWITDQGLNAIVVVSTSGKVKAVHPLSTADARPWGIAVGPDQNLWFAEYGASQIGRMTTSGELSEFPVPTAFSGVLNVAAGPDATVWFTEMGGSDWDGVGKVGYISTNGKIIRDFPGGNTLAHIHDLAFDHRGVLWYTEYFLLSSSLNEYIY